MKNFTNSDYALNKYSSGIVYSFADGTNATVTLADYLAANPGNTEADFRALKEISDGIYLKQVQKANAQTKRNKALNEMSPDMELMPSPEETLIDEIIEQENAERKARMLETANRALDALTDVQRRRYLMYHVEGKTEEQIAEIEGATHQAVSKSLSSANRKIKKFLANG